MRRYLLVLTLLVGCATKYDSKFKEKHDFSEVKSKPEVEIILKSVMINSKGEHVSNISEVYAKDDYPFIIGKTGEHKIKSRVEYFERVFKDSGLFSKITVVGEPSNRKGVYALEFRELWYAKEHNSRIYEMVWRLPWALVTVASVGLIPYYRPETFKGEVNVYLEGKKIKSDKFEEKYEFWTWLPYLFLPSNNTFDPEFYTKRNIRNYYINEMLSEVFQKN